MQGAAATIVLPRLPPAIPRSGISDSARLALRQWFGDVDRRLAQAYAENQPVHCLVESRALAVEALLRHVWTAVIGDQSPMALYAAGGFGRRELFPHSDVDLLVLCEAQPTGSTARSLETLFACLWDLGLRPGHAVRTVAQCCDIAAQDISVYTSLLDARHLAGSHAHSAALFALLRDDDLCTPQHFLDAKRAEQAQRHARYNDTAYNLEPNIKEGPGGLRSLQLIDWLSRRLFETSDWNDLCQRGLLADDEPSQLESARNVLWRIRFALHLLAGRAEERLLFDYQRELARRLGYLDEHAQNLAVEQFMQVYFRAAIAIERSSATFQQVCDEALTPHGLLEASPVDDQFIAIAGRLDAREPDLFERRPASVIDVFRVLAENAELSGLRAAAQRRLQAAMSRHGSELRGSADVHAAFLRLLRLGAPAVEAIARLSRFGVLAQYLPAFGEVVGRMQYDLFHVYTVDEHTLRVLRIVARFASAQTSREFALAHDLFVRIPRPELLLLAALFHDIAKGRGGDHSELGESDAREFCAQLGMVQTDIDTVAWLVRWHLLMSVTAQRQDITDADVVHRFAVNVAEWERLDLLYLLTCADIAGTSPKLWNSWKDRLLADLYVAARYVLRSGLERPPHAMEQVRDCQDAAMRELTQGQVDPVAIARIWADFPEESFLRYRPAQIAWQTAGIAQTPIEDLPLVLLHADSPRGGTEIFIYAEDRDGLFAAVTATLDRLHLNVQEARVVSARSGMSLDTFVVLDQRGKSLGEAGKLAELESSLREALLQRPYRATLARRSVARPLRHFQMSAQLEFRRDSSGRRTQVSVVCSDRPGLLATMAQVFREHRLRVHDARIATFGERVEDFFLLTDQHDAALTIDGEQSLREALRARIDTTSLPTLTSTKEMHASP
ncbi:MAG: [protein-PII] uridylyltransferase [Tahibacter sp.]